MVAKSALTAEEIRTKALARLSHRESSAAMLREFLLRKGATAEQVGPELERLTEQGFLSDARFTRMFVRETLLRKKGAGWIRRALEQRGISIDEHELRNLIDELEPDAELHGMTALIERKYAHWKDDEKVKLKATRALIGRGYSYSQIQKLYQDWGKD